MVMSTPILDEATEYIRRNILIDRLDICEVGATVTRGFVAVPATTTVIQHDVQCLVQTIDIPQPGAFGDLDGVAVQQYSIKVPKGTRLEPGMAARVSQCWREPTLVDTYLLVDSVSENGSALLRKATATRFHQVNGTGKDRL